MKSHIDTASATETEDFARSLGERLRGGEVLELVSDLGGGKTTFTRGLAKGFGSEDKVASPTFTVSKVYKSGNKELHHFDFYRLNDPGIMTHELHDLLEDPSVVLVIEWAEAVHHVLPDERLTILLARTGDDSRQIDLTYPDKLRYLVDGLC